MQDHVLYGITFRVNLLTSSRLLYDPSFAAQSANEYLTNQTGMLTSPVGPLAWEKLPPTYRQTLSNSTLSALTEHFPPDWPEIEILASDGFRGYGRQPMNPMDGHDYATISAALVAPLSRGTVSINSTDAADPPLINPNWLTHPADREVMVAAFKRVRELWAHLGAVTIGAEYFPGANVTSDAQILEFVQEALATVYHASCTCAMGRQGEPGAVVDARARVFGVGGLRVVDASAFPLLVPGHPQASVYMLAEKIAEDVRSGR